MSQRDLDLAEDYQRETLRQAAMDRVAELAKRYGRRTRQPQFRWGYWARIIGIAVLIGAGAWLFSLMPMPDAIGIVRDILVLTYLLVLRFGVPLLITLMLGSFIQHWLQQQDAKEMLARQQFTTGGESCWEKKNCSEEARENCPAYQRPDLPCWLALQVAGYGLKEQCYDCPLYTTQHVAVPIQS